MGEIERGRWEQARLDVLQRWRRILSRIEVFDEPGTLELANVMDELCEEAIFSREASPRGRPGEMGPHLKLPTAGAPRGSRCLYCRAFAQMGGCFGMLEEFNQAILKKRWGRARDVAESYIRLLEGMRLGAGSKDARRPDAQIY
jgi:hypothetical protein